MNVEFIYDASCPNAARARSLLLRAFARTGVSARWKEWERGAPDAPPYVRRYGSPTLLVNGRDVAGLPSSSGSSACRLYPGEDGALQGVPSLELVCAALLGGAAGDDATVRGGRWRTAVASLPAIGTALLPKLTCPLCWPAYAALLGALGIGFFDYTPYLAPLTLVFLALAIGGLTLQSRRSGHRGALIAGAAGAAVVLIAKFVLDSAWINHIGIGLLIAAIFMSTRRRARAEAPCAACVTNRRKPQAERR